MLRVFEVPTTTVEGCGVVEVLLLRIRSISNTRGKYFEYLKYNVEDVLKVNEVSRGPVAAGAFQKVFGVLAISCYILPHV